MTESPEQTIPEEVMRKARTLADYALCFGYTQAVLLIARSLLSAEARGREAQREADARIAEDDDGHFSVWGEDRNTAVAQQTCRDIATAIRNA